MRKKELEAKVEYLVSNIECLIDRINNRRRCRAALGEKENNYENDIVRVLRNIVIGESEPFNLRQKLYGKKAEIIIVDEKEKENDRSKTR